MIDDCPFCRIPTTGSEHILARNERCYVIDHGPQIHPPGMMIIPFRHIETPFELTPDEWAALQPLLLEAKTQLDRLAPDGYNIGWNVLPVGGQSVPHAHLHITARFADEPYAGRGIRSWIKSPGNRRPGSQNVSGEEN